jgi:hypothetical protein
VKNIKVRSKAALFAVLLTTVMMISPFLSTAQAATPTPTNWTGTGAMAYWNIKNSTGSTIATIEVVIAEQGLDAQGYPDATKANLLYITVTHVTIGGGRVSENTTYNVPFSWSINGFAFIQAQNIVFPWGTTTRPHNITIAWTAPPMPNLSFGYYLNRTGAIITAPGVWATSTAQIIIDGESGPHPSMYTSDWAIVGANMQLVGTYRDWQVLLFKNRIYIAPPSNLPKMPQLMSIGTFDSAYYSKIGWSAVDAAKPQIDTLMSSPYLM